MKKLSNLLAALVFVSLVIFISCTTDSGGTDPEDPLETQAALLSGTWTTTANQVLYQGSPSTDGDWANFTLTITNATTSGGDYSTSGVPAGFEDVWDAAGTWTFANSSGTIITRATSNGGNAGPVDITVVAGETSLELSFNNTGTLGRTAGIEGTWKFTMNQ